jgi:hypothetical protein
MIVDWFLRRRRIMKTRPMRSRSDPPRRSNRIYQTEMNPLLTICICSKSNLMTSRTIRLEMSRKPTPFRSAAVAPPCTEMTRVQRLRKRSSLCWVRIECFRASDVRIGNTKQTTVQFPSWLVPSAVSVGHSSGGQKMHRCTHSKMASCK